MVGIVETDADELSRAGDAGTEARLAGDGRQGLRIEPGKAGERRRIQGLAADVGDVAGQIADGAVRIDETGLFGAGGAIANKFHTVLQFNPNGYSVQPPSMAYAWPVV